MPGYTTARLSVWERAKETTPAARVDSAAGVADVWLQREDAHGGDTQVGEVLNGLCGGGVGAGGWVRERRERYM